MPKRRPPIYPEATLSPDIPVDVVRQEFANRLNRAILEKGWTQSELARRASPYAPNKRMIRDNISKYCRAHGLPGALHLRAICKALGKEPVDLLPSRGAQGGGTREHPALAMQDLSDGNAWLRVNQAVPMGVALKVAALLIGDEE